MPVVVIPRRSLFRAHLRGLGAAPATLSPAAALQQAVALYGGAHLNPKQFSNSGWLAQAQGNITSASFSTPGCTTTGPKMNLLATASGISLSAAGATSGALASASLIPAAAVPVIGWVVAGIGAIVGLISAIFAHHAQAVARDAAFGCSAIPAVNNAFSVIRQAVNNGQIKPEDAANALPQIYAEFMAAGGAGGTASGGPSGIPGGGQPINDSPWCNSNCEISVILLGMIFYWQSQFMALAAQAAAVQTAPVDVTVSAPASQPNTVAAPPVPAPSPSGVTVVSPGAQPAAPAPVRPAPTVQANWFSGSSSIAGKNIPNLALIGGGLLLLFFVTGNR